MTPADLTSLRVGNSVDVHGYAPEGSTKTLMLGCVPWPGERAIEAVRALNGATDGVAAAPGSIRGDLCASKQENVVHASDSPEAAAREVALWFPGV